MSVENYQSMVFFDGDSLITILAFLFPKIQCAVSKPKARYYFAVNVASVCSQYSSLSLSEKNSSGTAQSDALP